MVDRLILKGREELETYLMFHKQRHHVISEYLEPLLAAKRGDGRLGLGARDGSADTAFLADFLSAKYAHGSRQ